MTNTTLKPCPFCGAPGELIHNAHWDYFVRCTDKRCAARTRQHHENENGAVLGWNKRDERTCTVEKFEQNPSYGDYYCELSCGHWFDVVDDKPPAYCPRCGAKVVEG